MVSLPDHGESQNVMHISTEASQSRLTFPLKGSLLSACFSSYFSSPTGITLFGAFTAHYSTQVPLPNTELRTREFPAKQISDCLLSTRCDYKVQIMIFKTLSNMGTSWSILSVITLTVQQRIRALLYFLPSTCHHLTNILFRSFCSPRYPQCLELS